MLNIYTYLINENLRHQLTDSKKFTTICYKFIENWAYKLL